MVRLSTANTYSYRKGELPHPAAQLASILQAASAGPHQPLPAVDLPFQEYVEHLLHPQDPTSLGNSEFDLVGHGVGWGHLECPGAKNPAPPVFLVGRHLVFLWGQQFQRVGITVSALLSTTI